MRRLVKFLVFLIIMCFIMNSSIISGSSAKVPENYTSLGDSIAYGMSASPGNGYTDLFYKYLKNINGNSNMKEINYGTSGDSSSDLLSKVTSNKEIKDSIKESKVISISIGGNNVLNPIISAASEAFHVERKSTTFTKDLGDKIKAAQDLDSIIQSLMVSQELQKSIIGGAARFALDWPRIIAAIKELSPNGHIYVMTIYNPVNVADPLFNVFEQIIKQMNGIIQAFNKNEAYKIVDVYSAFKEYNEKEKLVNFSLAVGQADPHPTDKGHEIIFQAFSNIANTYETIIPAVVTEKPKVKASPSPKDRLSKVTGITSSKYKIDKNRFVISITMAKIPKSLFFANIKTPKNSTCILLKSDKKTAITGPNVEPGMFLLVKAEDNKTVSMYSIVK